MSLWDNLRTIKAIMLAVAIRVPKAWSRPRIGPPPACLSRLDSSAPSNLPPYARSMSWVCGQRETCLDCAFTWLIFREDTQLNMTWKKTLSTSKAWALPVMERVQICYQRTFAHAFLWSEDIFMHLVVFALTRSLDYSTQLWMSFQSTTVCLHNLSSKCMQ